MGFLDDRILVVHGVQFGAAELERIAAKGATLVTCPRGNLRTGAGAPPVEAFYESGNRVAIGTDSLASVPDLNLFAELAQLRRLAPDVRARALIESATINGARALGFDRDFGTIEAGKHDGLIAVELDGTVSNVEEYLVSGIRRRRFGGCPRHERRAIGGRPSTSVLIKHARDAFGSQEKIDAQWKRLNFVAPPDFGRAVAEYDAFLEILRETGTEIWTLPVGEGLTLDSIYTRDASVVGSDGTILQHGQTRPGGGTGGPGAGIGAGLARRRAHNPSWNARRRRRDLARRADGRRRPRRPHERGRDSPAPWAAG